MNLDAVAPLKFPRCEFPLIDIQEVYGLISEKLGKQEPASVIRIGDGEGMVLARPTPEDPTLWTHVKAHFGPEVTEQFIALLADQLVLAVNNADVVGIRSDLVNVEFDKANFGLDENRFTERFRHSFKLRSAEKNISYPGALRLALTHRFLSENIFPSHTLFGSAWLHFELSENGALIDLLRTQNHIGLISSKHSLFKQLEELFDIKVNFFRIPEFYAAAADNADSRSADSLPDKLLKTLDLINVEFRGQLFFVGAGVFGKVYCQRIKELGGIALDIGSVCDTWVDIPSRPMVFKSRYGSTGDTVPECLLLENQVNRFL